MVYKLTKKAEGMLPLAGVPWRDMEDAEFADVAKWYSESNGGKDHGFPPRVLHDSGFFEHAEDKAESKAKGD